MKHVSSILKRPMKNETDIDHEDEEEESAYNEHFKNNADKPGPGEFRVPSIRVRPSGGGAPPVTSQPSTADYTGTATEQGKHDGAGGEIFLKQTFHKYFMIPLCPLCPPLVSAPHTFPSAIDSTK